MAHYCLIAMKRPRGDEVTEQAARRRPHQPSDSTNPLAAPVGSTNPLALAMVALEAMELTEATRRHAMFGSAEIDNVDHEDVVVIRDRMAVYDLPCAKRRGQVSSFRIGRRDGVLLAAV